MTELVLGLDQGTSSTRCLAFDRDLVDRGAAAVPVHASFPAAGRVEQDPEELLSSASAAIAQALAAAGAAPADVIALGIANQTETFVVCDRSSGRALHPAIVWQDRRTADRCAALAAAGHEERVRARTGLELDATFPATKIGWLLDHVADARARAEAGELVYHDVAGWLLRRGAGIEVADVGNAGRSLLTGLGAGDWDDDLLELFDVPRALMPPIADSDAIGSAPAAAPAAWPGLRVTAALGDQQASLFGLGCRAPGAAKVTLGTGAFILAHAGHAPLVPPRGVLASCAWRTGGEASYALEGFIPAAGAALTWCAELGLLPAPGQLGALLARAGSDDGSVACVPALQGLGTPVWEPDTRGAFLGLTRATTRAQIARAVVDGVLHQVADALDAIRTAIAVESVQLDGGMSQSDWIVQRLAEIAGIPVQRAARSEATATGAAMLAGLAAGVWEDAAELPAIAADRIVEPSWSPDERAARRERWREALEAARRWRGGDHA